MAGITVADLEKRYRFPEGFLDEECTSEHIREIALVLDEWELLATHLLLSEGQIEDIKRSSNSQQVKRKNVLSMWKEAHAFTATYRRLLEVLLTIKRAGLACTICQLVVPQQGHLQASHSSPMQHLPMRPKQPLAQSAPLAAVPRASSQTIPVSTVVSPSKGTIGSPHTTPQHMTTRSVTAHQATIKGIENEFLKVVVQVEESFDKGVSLKQLQRVACHLPVDLKGQFGRLFQEESSRIWRAKTIGELFTILSYFWDYLHPDLLLHLVGRFDIEDTMTLAAEYERNLSKFRKQVKILDYIGERSINLEDEDYTPIVAIFGDEWCDKTLADLEEVRRSFAKRFSFLRLLPKMNGLKYNSIAIIFSVPKFVRLDHEELREFFQSYNALKLSVSGVCIYDSQPKQATISEDEIPEVIPEGQQEASVVKGKENHSNSEEQETRISKSKSSEAGGFPCQFIEQPPKAFQSECPVCLQILREPYQVTCCGTSFCGECVKCLNEYNSHCPTCNEENITAYPNKGLQRSLYDYDVYCTHKDEGCEWTGELRQLERHLNLSPRIGEELQGCLFTHVDCKFKSVGCKETPCRGDMPTHLREHSEVHLQLLQTSNSPLNVVFIEDQQQIAKLSQQVLGVNKTVSAMEEKHERELSSLNRKLTSAAEEQLSAMKQQYEEKLSKHKELLGTATEQLSSVTGQYEQQLSDANKTLKRLITEENKPTSSALKLPVPKPIDKEAQEKMSEEKVKAESVQLDFQISKLTQANKQLEYSLSLQHYHDQDNEFLVKFQQQLQQQKEEVDQIKAQMEHSYRWWEIPSEEVKIIRVLEQEGWGYIAKGKFHGQKVSIKCLLQEVLSHSTTGQIRHLMSTMAQIQHPNLLPFLGAVVNPESSENSLLIVSELTDTTLRSAYKDNLLEERFKLPILSDIASALCCLHSQRQSIIHGGVTSANVLLEGKRNNTWKAKLSDFGSANLLYLGPTASEHTTPYSAPEISQGRELTIKLDVYSFGVLVCEVVLCQLPPDPQEFPAMLKDVQASQDQDIYAIAEDCTKQSPSDRPFMSSISDRIIDDDF